MWIARTSGFGLLISSVIGYAQTLPDAGALRQQIDQGLRQPVLPQAAPEREPLPPEMAPSPGVTVTVKAFRFAGNKLLSDDQLAPVVAPWVGHPIGYVQLRDAAAAVANAYRDAGWIVRAYLPKQDITAGTVTIQIVEAVFGGVSIEGPQPSRVSADRLLARISAAQPKGAPLNAAAIDRALLLADDLPGVAVSGALAPGKSEGETDLVLKTTDEPLLTGALSTDNQGSRSTGTNRLMFSGTLSSPLRLGDRLRLNYMKSDGSEYDQFDYSLPMGGDGWRAGVNGSQLRYRLTAPEFAQLHGFGTSDSVGANLSYPMIRARLKNLYASLDYANKSFHNEASGTVQSSYNTKDWTLSLYGNLFDQFGGGGANSATLSLTSGRVDLGQLDTAENANLDGSFGKLNYSLARQQVLTEKLSIYTAFTGQSADSNLDSSERFSLGGPSGVRAYPVGEGTGKNGQLANLEMRWRLPRQFVLTGFYDWGKVSNSAPTPSYELKGYGLSLAWSAPYGIDLKATWARRDGSNPNPTSTGKDQDGSLYKDRLWLSATVNF